MPVSETARRALYAPESEEVFLVLLTIDHDGLSQPIRVVNNLEQVNSRGEEFIAFPFSISLPDDKEESPPRARLAIDNVTREIGQAVRQMTGPARVTLEVIMASAPDTVEASWPGFLLRNVVYDVSTVQGDLTVEDLTREPYPARRFNPGSFPGIF